MRAIILAAGRGSRMKELTDDRPKGLVELRGKPLIEWQLAALQSAGIQQIAIVTGYKRELFAERGMREFHNPRWAETNMVSSLDCAREWLALDTCIVSYSDIFYDATAPQLLISSRSALAITYDVGWLAHWKRRFDDPLSDAETLAIGPDGSLSQIGGKPRSLSEVQGQYMGLLRVTPLAWAEVQRIRDGMTAVDRDTMHMTGTLQKVIEAGRILIEPIPYLGEWGEIDSRQDLELYSGAGPAG